MLVYESQEASVMVVGMMFEIEKRKDQIVLLATSPKC